jgi:hypothetical protein
MNTEQLLKIATPRPWVTDDRHIHPKNGLTYPKGDEPETDVILLVDTDYHADGFLKPADDANLELVCRAVNSFEAMRAALKGMLQEAPHPTKNVKKEFHYLVAREAAVKALELAGDVMR